MTNKIISLLFLKIIFGYQSKNSSTFLILINILLKRQIKKLFILISKIFLK